MSYDGGDTHETRRNAAIAVGVSVTAVAMVGLLFWIFSSLRGPDVAATTTANTRSATTSGTQALAPAPSETTAGPPPTIAPFTPSTTVSLPPPEQPTMTAPAAPESAAQPSPPPQANTPPPAGPSVGNVRLSCTRLGAKGITAKLTFTATTKIDVVLSAGSQADRKSAGPGNVALSVAGRGPGICFAKLGDQVVGPIQAS